MGKQIEAQGYLALMSQRGGMVEVRTRSDGEISDGSKEIGTDLFGQTKRPISEGTSAVSL